MARDADLSLTVYFDMHCQLCRNVARWLQSRETYLPLHVVAAQRQAAGEKCPVDPDSLLRDLTLIASDGAVYRGAKAFLMCLWATRGYRGWAMRLSSEAGLPWAKRLYGIIARLGRVSRSESRPKQAQ